MSTTQEKLFTTTLPSASYDGNRSLESCIRTRRSIRSFPKASLSLDEVSQLLWSAQGITAETGERAAPSAGATYPLETYLVVGNVTDLQAGIYKYQVENHRLACINLGDRIAELAQGTLGQDCVREAAAVVVFSAVYERTRKEYGPVADIFVHMEVGHVAENFCLQAVALNLGTVCVAAFKEAEVRTLLQLPKSEVVLYMVPVGRMRE